MEPGAKQPNPEPVMTEAYSHPSYAESLREFGTPRLLTESGGMILERQIPHTEYQDAMGCYPLFCCQNWDRVSADLEQLRNRLVAVSLVADPFGEYAVERLCQCFDVVREFKQHFIVDLGHRLSQSISAHHRRNVRTALRSVDVERCDPPSEYLTEWIGLYQGLVARHAIRGIPVFSSNVFAEQLRVPGIVLFRALHSGMTVGMTVWFVQEGVAYYHLGASSNRGYQLRASFALFWKALEWFAGSGVALVDLGGVPGLNASDDGLFRFKRGWSTVTRPTYFCGRVLDMELYALLVGSRRGAETTYFPAYRDGEFR
jgi:hypothetical protein